MKLLLVRTSSLGDIAHCIPVFLALRRALPEAELCWLVNDEYQELLERGLGVDQVFGFDRRSWRRGQWSGALKQLLALRSQLKDQRFDAILDWQGLLRSSLLTFALARGRRFGYAEAREGTLLYHCRDRSPKPREHPTERAWRLARRVCPGLGAPEIWSGPDAAVLGELTLPEAYSLVAPGARWSSKAWPESHWRELLKAWPGPVMLIGGQDERALCERLATATGAESLAGRTNLLQLGALVARARVLVAGDSGPLHLAVAMGRPTVSMYGSTVWFRTYPRHRDSIMLMRRGLDCLACRQRSCPISGHPCMQEITPEMVLRVVSWVLGHA